MTQQLERMPPHLAARHAVPAADSARWLQRYVRALVALDVAMLLVAALVAVWVRFGVDGALVRGLSYYGFGLLLVVVWLSVLALSRCYEARFVGSGSEEFKRIANASIRLLAVVASVSYVFKLDIARGFVAAVLPLGLLLLLLGRYGARVLLHRQRRVGRCCHRVIVVGGVREAASLVAELRREPLAGLFVVGACVPGGGDSLPVGGPPVPVVGTLSTLTSALVAAHADTVAVASSAAISSEALRRLSYELEGTGVDLLVAPALTTVTGTRVSIRPVAGLPLLHVDEPELTGGRKLLKGAFDRSVALVALILLAPLLLLLSAAVALTSRGPVLFRQVRVGRGGKPFRLWKFRSMSVGAEQALAGLEHLNEHDGLLFKMREDPRVTPLGRRLRRYSLDELPQLVNVVRGHMSLVGPRPPLPSEVSRYVGDIRRRLLVKPGLTGLWQVSGRSNLSWEDSVRLDLHYVENWSLGLDLSILARTLATVARGSGAY